MTLTVILHPYFAVAGRLVTTVFRMTPAFQMSPLDKKVRVYNEVKSA